MLAQLKCVSRRHVQISYIGYVRSQILRKARHMVGTNDYRNIVVDEGKQWEAWSSCHEKVLKGEFV